MANPNENYNRLEDEIKNLINIHLPTKIVRYNKHKHTKSQWITSGIVKSISFRDKLYKKLKQTPQDSQNLQNLKTNLKTYNKVLKKISTLRKKKIQSKFAKHTNNAKDTWSVIKEILNKSDILTISKLMVN